MPVSVRRSPFDGEPRKRTNRAPRLKPTPAPPAPPIPPAYALRIPQVRVLAVLVPEPDTDPTDWPVVNRTQLSACAGFTPLSGTVTRVLNGIRAGSSSGDAHPGLLARGMVGEVVLDIDGVKEVNYRATAKGAEAYRLHIQHHGPPPPQRPRESCTNRNQGRGDNHRSKRNSVSMSQE